MQYFNFKMCLFQLSDMNDKPKRPFFPYRLFYRDFRMRNGHMTRADLFKSATAEWKSLPDNDKQVIGPFF